MVCIVDKMSEINLYKGKIDNSKKVYKSLYIDNQHNKWTGIHAHIEWAVMSDDYLYRMKAGP